MLGPKYHIPRGIQEEILWHIYTEKKPITFLQAPTGIGKSGIAMCLAEMMQVDTAAIATSTISLQEQYSRDFPALKVLKGRNNFRCELDSRYTAAEAPCAFGYARCDNGYHLQEDNFDDYSNRCFVTNYSMLLSDILHGERWKRRPPGLLVLDEGHNLLNHLTAAETITLDSELANGVGIKCPSLNDLAAAKKWCAEKEDVVEARVYSERMRFGRNLSSLLSLWRQIGNVLSAPNGLIVLETGKRLTASPIWPSSSATSLLNISSTLLIMSATMGDGTFLADVLSWPKDSVSSLAVPSPFPSSNWPVYFTPVASLSKKSSPNDWNRVSERCHELSHERPGDSGVIHVASSRQVEYISRELLRCPTCRSRVVLVRLGERRSEAIDRFRANRGSVLIHPSVGEGESFDDEQCRFQIIAKLPWPDLSDKLTRLRMEDGAMGKEWYAAHTASKIAQACGRGMRHEDDYCENFILDGAFARLYDQNRNLFPSWFIAQLR